ncbi:MAG: ATP-dependent Clp protease ATP-binding subunit [Erysipelotrichales bacterium]|nr:ATP-dependent Clp protease ATP-binding subunit [Erysipelotrichales bacterium]
MSQELINLIELAEQIAHSMHDSHVGSEHLLLAILKNEELYLTVELADYDMSYYSVMEDLVKCYREEPFTSLLFTRAVENIFELSILKANKESRPIADVDDLCDILLHYENSTAFELFMEYQVDVYEIEKGLAKKNYMNELNKIKELTNLNQKMENQKPIVLCRENEINKIITVLSRKEKSNPLLIGEPGTGKSAIIEELARRIVNNEVTDYLRNYVIYELNINNLVAGTKYRGEFEEKIERICSTVKKYNDVILFIDEIHQIVGAGKAEGSIDVATVFKPYLARNEIRVIGATTINEYSKYIEKDRALERRFQTLVLEEPNAEMTLQMIVNKVNALKRFHHVEINEDVVRYAVYESEKYLLSRHFPDKAIDVIDLACTKAKLADRKNVTENDVRVVIDDLCNMHFDMKYDLKNLYSKYNNYHTVLSRIEQLLADFDESIDELPKAIWNFKSNSLDEATAFVSDLSKELKMEKVILPMQLYNESSSLYQLTGSKESTFYKPWNDLKKTPSYIFVLLNFDKAHNDVKKFFYNIFETGKWKNCDGTIYDFRHSVFMLTTYNDTSHNIGFDRNTKVISNSYFDEEFVLERLGKNEYISVAKDYLRKYDMEIADNELDMIYEDMNSKNVKQYLKIVLRNVKKNYKNRLNKSKDMVK